MSSMPSQHILDLYIHPDKGPIKPVTLDLMEIEVAVHNSKFAALDRDEERFRQIANRIKQQFPYVDPESNRKGLVSILARFSQAYQFNGVVLRLSGTIEDGSVPSIDGVERLSSQVEVLAQEVPKLKRLLEIEQQAHRATKEQIVRLEIENKQLVRDRDIAFDRNKTRIEDLQEQVRQRADQLRLVREESDRGVRDNSALRIQIEQLEDENEELNKHLESQKKKLDDLQSLLRERENELARLRMDVRNAEAKEKQLQETIERQREEIRELQESLDKLMQEASTQTNRSGPFLDY